MFSAYSSILSLIGGSSWAETYYAYDDLGRLCWVVTPEGSAILPSAGTLTPASPMATAHCYIYKYDGKGNVVEKTSPSAGTVYYVYDKGGRMVMSQDPNQRSLGQWTFVVYDNINRPVEKSVVSTSLGRSQIQQAYNGTDNTYPYPAGSDRVDIPLGSSSYTPVRFLESVRYAGGSYMPVHDEQQHQLTLSNSAYMMVDTTNIIHWGAYYQEDSYGLYLQQDDNVRPEYYICSDATYPEIKYYYIP